MNQVCQNTTEESIDFNIIIITSKQISTSEGGVFACISTSSIGLRTAVLESRRRWITEAEGPSGPGSRLLLRSITNIQQVLQPIRPYGSFVTNLKYDP